MLTTQSCFRDNAGCMQFLQGENSSRGVTGGYSFNTTIVPLDQVWEITFANLWVYSGSWNLTYISVFNSSIQYYLQYFLSQASGTTIGGNVDLILEAGDYLQWHIGVTAATVFYSFLATGKIFKKGEGVLD